MTKEELFKKNFPEYVTEKEIIDRLLEKRR